jgi:hypothetical protein
MCKSYNIYYGSVPRSKTLTNHHHHQQQHNSCLPRFVLRGTTSTPKYPSNFGPKSSNVLGFYYKNKPAQVVVPWHFLRLKKYRFVFFGPILAKL